MKEQTKSKVMEVSKTKEQPKKSDKPTITQTNEVETLKKEIEKLKSQLDNQPESLEEKIKFFQQKQEMIKRLRLLNDYAENLLNVQEQINESLKENDVFLSDHFQFKIQYKQNSYGSPKDVLTIAHPKLIGDVLGFAIGKIQDKRTEIQNQINA